MMRRKPAQIDSDIEEYLDLLERNVHERIIQRFLSEHAYFFNCIARHHVPIFSKVRLGAEYEADFAYYEPSSFGVEWHFVEIEPAGTPLCTANGRISAKLNHAFQQARDWKEWIADNRPYARKTMPLVEYPFFHVFAGRRSSLDTKAQDLLRYLNHEFRHWLQVATLDRFASGAESAKTLRVMQMTAYTYSQMSQGQPKESFAWLRDRHTATYKERRAAQLLEERVSSDESVDSPVALE